MLKNIENKYRYHNLRSEILRSGFEKEDDFANYIDMKPRTLKNKLMELTSGYQAAVDTLMKETKDGYFTMWSLLDYTTGDEIDFSDYLVEKGLQSSGSYGTGGGHIYLPNDSFDDVIESYEKLLAIREALNEGISEGRWTREELAESDIYTKVTDRLADMKEEYESVLDNINQINSISAQLMFAQIPSSDLPKTAEEFEALKGIE